MMFLMPGCTPDAHEIPTLLDEQVLADLYEDFASTDDLGDLADLIRGFLERGAQQLDRVRASIEHGDAEAVRQTAHKLKGSSRTLGANLAGEVAAAIEAAGDAGDLLVAKRLIPELEVTFALSRAALLDAVEAIDGGGAPVVGAPVVETGRALRVLVADDEPIALAVLRAGVERLGHSCCVAVDGSGALCAFEHERADIVISDFQMPGLDGIEVASRIRSAAAEPTPYLVVLSASGDDAQLKESIGSVVDAVLSKPLREDELRAVLALAAQRRA